MCAKSTVCKAAPRLGALLLTLSLLVLPAFAYAGSDTVGQPGMLLAAMSGNGSLTAESTLGSAAADAVRGALNADAAIVCGGEFIANLQPHPVTYDEVRAVFQDPDRTLAVAEVTAVQLKEILENGFSHITLSRDESIDRASSTFAGYPQLSGLTVVYDASARPGERVMRIELDGKKLDLSDDTARYTLAGTSALFAGENGFPVLTASPSSVTLSEALANYVASGVPDSYTGHDRITAVGCTEYNIINRVPRGVIAVACAIWIATRLWRYQKQERPAGEES